MFCKDLKILFDTTATLCATAWWIYCKIRNWALNQKLHIKKLIIKNQRRIRNCRASESRHQKPPRIRNKRASETAHQKPACIRDRRIGSQLDSETGGAYQKLAWRQCWGGGREHPWPNHDSWSNESAAFFHRLICFLSPEHPWPNHDDVHGLMHSDNRATREHPRGGWVG